jgi:hypothetical protein
MGHTRAHARQILPSKARPEPQRGKSQQAQQNSAPGMAGAPETQRGVSEMRNRRGRQTIEKN